MAYAFLVEIIRNIILVILLIIYIVFFAAYKNKFENDFFDFFNDINNNNKEQNYFKQYYYPLFVLKKDLIINLILMSINIIIALIGLIFYFKGGVVRIISIFYKRINES